MRSEHVNLAEVEILIAESALDSAIRHTARMKRRSEAADLEYSMAMSAEQQLRQDIKYMREDYLGSVV